MGGAMGILSLILRETFFEMHCDATCIARAHNNSIWILASCRAAQVIYRRDQVEHLASRHLGHFALCAHYLSVFEAHLAKLLNHYIDPLIDSGRRTRCKQHVMDLCARGLLHQGTEMPRAKKLSAQMQRKSQ